MSVTLHIWKGELPNRAVINALYRVDVGHAAMTIKTKKREIYISHRPKSLEEYIEEVQQNIEKNQQNKDDSKKYLLKDYAPKADYISFEEECIKRKRKPTVEIYIPDSYLNEDNMIKFYEKYINNDLDKNLCMYHVGKNNCCAALINFIRQGLECEFYNKKCGYCINKSTIYQNKGYTQIYKFATLYVALAINTRLIVTLLNLPEMLGLIITLTVNLIGLIFFPLVYLNLEVLITTFRPKWSFWSPLSLERFGKAILDRKSRCKRGFFDKLFRI
ncbi:MAG: hypothetical protein F6K50_13290 [Moorea sp. SIO3I7]|uniref:hypothetical protein n=1 Tax=Moorena sp. SIO3I8 TaxID=2607833 RepID=UPI0013C093B7|nr:hypothetical protein [Moorena sp. SIO3I8]NEN96474.1 hypothetical protein [Moorena sp. SIO3I7]NEO09778.1 hypothetical protein [Moorena sp. SIO3I8]